MPFFTSREIGNKWDNAPSPVPQANTPMLASIPIKMSSPSHPKPTEQPAYVDSGSKFQEVLSH